MARGNAPPDRRAKLEERRAKIDQQLRALEAREKQAERKRDTRRKIVAGGIVLTHAEMHPEFADQLNGLLERFVTRDADRELFGLPPKQQSAPANDALRDSFPGQQSGPSARTAGEDG
jgi:hypothetical protein